MVELYNAYDTFAWVYNKYWQDYSRTALPVLERILFPRLPEKAGILDLCCGAGQMLGRLLKRGYTAVGLDGSSQLLEFAEKNTPHGDFIHADARSFRLEKRFDAVICLFDSLNHMLEIRDIRQVFASVFTHLKAGGFFVLDLNLEKGFHLRWEKESSAIIADDHTIAIKTEYDSSTKIGRFDVSLFEKSGEFYKRSNITLYQKCYHRTEIIRALRQSGFIRVKTIDPFTRFKIGPPGRSYFRGQKPLKAGH